MLSSPVAFLFLRCLRCVFISDWVIGSSLGRSFRGGSGGLVSKYSLLENWRSGLVVESFWRDSSLYNSLKKVVRASN